MEMPSQGYSQTGCRESSAKVAFKKSLRAARVSGTTSIQSVYSFKSIVPVVQRIEQGFPNPTDFPSHEGSGASWNRQKAPIPAKNGHLSGNKWRRL